MTEYEHQPVLVNQTAIALIRRWVDEDQRWLVVHAGGETPPRLVEADRLEEESFRESIDREVAWQLNLRRGKDYIVSSVPRLHLEIPIEITHGCSDRQENRLDVVEFFLVELYGSQAHSRLAESPEVHWWSADELLAEPPSGGLLARQRQLLQIADILQAG